MTFSPHNSRMRELNNITESPEYKNTKYSDSKKNTITQKSWKEEVDEYNIYDSPRANLSSNQIKKRGLIINASGSKKSINSFNKTKENLSLTFKMLERQINNEIHSDRSHHNNNLNLSNGQLEHFTANAQGKYIRSNLDS